MRILLVLVLALQVYPATAQLYRWTDASGRVHYTDTPPPSGAKRMSQKDSAVSSSSSTEPFVLQQARRDFPVKLYSAPGCQPCDTARGLLNKRGVPFSEVSVNGDPEQLAELQKTTGVTGVPALLVGRNVQSGFEESIYHRMLDEAGYPKTGLMPERKQAEPPPVRAEPEVQGREPEALGPYAPRFSR